MTTFAEIPYENLCLGYNGVASLATETTTPYSINSEGKWQIEEKDFEPMDNFGTLVENYRSAVTDRRVKLSGSGVLDLDTLPLLFATCLKGSVTATHPASGVLSWLHTFNPTITSDDLQALTAIWGDPNIQLFESNYFMLDDFTIKADAGSDTGTMLDWSGVGQNPSKITDYPDVPLAPLGPLLLPKDMQVSIDTSSAIGTTHISDRVVSVEHKFTSGITRKKYLTNASSGPQAGVPTFSTHGRDKKGRRLETTITFEMPDMVQYDLWAAQTALKVRVRHYGSPLIETVAGPITYYPYLQVDTYGKLTNLTFAEHEGSNRTITLTVKSRYNSGAGNDMGFVILSDQQNP